MFTTIQIAQERLDVCKSCSKFSAIKTCRLCGCVMPLKVKLRHSDCPIEKWKAIEDDGQMHYVDDDAWEKLGKD